MDVTNKNKNLAKALSSATCALLGAIPTAQAGKLDLWDLEASVLYYSESDGRVSAIEPVVELKKKFTDGREASLKLTLDALTGATPTGALASNTAQTFTRPSGTGEYTVQANEIPLDDTFRDTRIAANGTWKQPLNRLTSLTLGLNASKEYDFFSLGSSVQLARDFNQKNTTVMLGVSTEFDQVDPVGGVPVAFAAMVPAGQAMPRKGSGESKSVLDGMLGVTQVVNRKTLMQVNYSVSQVSGYLNDPYKLLTRVDPVTGVSINHVYENRPDSRLRHAVYWLTRYNLNRDVVSASYRYFFDDWGIKSHTLDLNYNWKYSETQYLEPRLRFYSQTEADFFKLFLLSTDPLPQEASADYRLAQFNGLTYGLKWGKKMKNDSEIILRFEYYAQMGDSNPSEAFGVLKQQDLYPDLKAMIAQIQYRF